jgi:hypothetical protein
VAPEGNDSILVDKIQGRTKETPAHIGSVRFSLNRLRTPAEFVDYGAEKNCMGKGQNK